MTQTIVFDANNQPLKKANAENIEGANKYSATLRRTNTEARELNRLVAKGAREGETATQKFQRRQELLNRAFKEGKINQQELSDSLKSITNELEEAGKESDNFTGSLTRGLLGAVGLTATLSSAVSAAKTAFADAAQQANKFADLSAESVDARGQLAQVATSQEDFQFLLEGARQLRAAGAVSSLDTGARASFAIRSAGLDADRGTFQRIGASALTDDLAGLAKSVATVSNAFGKVETGNTESIVSKALAASGVSPENINAILEATARTGQGARTIGLRDEEALSAVSLLSADLGSASDASTQIRALFKSLEVAGFTAGTLQDRIAKAQEQIDSGTDIRKLLGGRQEAVSAFRFLERNTKRFSDNLANIDRAADGSQLATSLSLSEGDANLRAGLERRRAAGRLEVSQDLIATRENAQQAALDQLDLINTALGTPEVGRSFRRFAQETISDFTPADVVSSRQIEDLRRSTRDEAILKMIDKLEELVQEFRSTGQRVRAGEVPTVPTVPTPEAN